MPDSFSLAVWLAGGVKRSVGQTTGLTAVETCWGCDDIKQSDVKVKCMWKYLDSGRSKVYGSPVSRSSRRRRNTREQGRGRGDSLCLVHLLYQRREGHSSTKVVTRSLIKLALVLTFPPFVLKKFVLKLIFCCAGQVTAKHLKQNVI